MHSAPYVDTHECQADPVGLAVPPPLSLTVLLCVLLAPGGFQDHISWSTHPFNYFRWAHHMLLTFQQVSASPHWQLHSGLIDALTLQQPQWSNSFPPRCLKWARKPGPYSLTDSAYILWGTHPTGTQQMGLCTLTCWLLASLPLLPPFHTASLCPFPCLSPESFPVLRKPYHRTGGSVSGI